MLAVVVAHGRVVAQAAQRLGGADDLTSERVLPEHRLGEVVVDELRRRVFVERDLFEDDLALRVEVGHERSRDHVGHDGEGFVEMVVEEARVDERVLLGGRRVELAAHLVEDAGDVPRRVARRCP